MQRLGRLVLLLALLPVAAAAQETRGNISGTVRDHRWRRSRRGRAGEERRHQHQPEPGHQRLRVLRGAAAQSRQLRSHRRDERVPQGDARQHRVGRRPAGEPALHAGGGRDQRGNRGPRRDARARYELSVVRCPVRPAAGRVAADVREHADHAVALRAGHERQRCADVRLAGVRRQHVALGRIGPRSAAGRHTEPGDAAGRRQQLHPRRCQQQRQ